MLCVWLGFPLVSAHPGVLLPLRYNTQSGSSHSCGSARPNNPVLLYVLCCIHVAFCRGSHTFVWHAPSVLLVVLHWNYSSWLLLSEYRFFWVWHTIVVLLSHQRSAFWVKHDLPCKLPKHEPYGVMFFDFVYIIKDSSYWSQSLLLLLTHVNCTDRLHLFIIILISCLRIIYWMYYFSLHAFLLHFMLTVTPVLMLCLIQIWMPQYERLYRPGTSNHC